MISDTDWELLNKRLESIERSIEMLKSMFPIPQAPTPYKPYPTIDHYKALGEIPCVFDNMPESEKMKPLCISCPCPRCIPYALSYGNLTTVDKQGNEYYVLKEGDFMEPGLTQKWI